MSIKKYNYQNGKRKPACHFLSETPRNLQYSYEKQIAHQVQGKSYKSCKKNALV
jgi:hypothetical protein